MLFYDCEVFPYDWMFVIADTEMHTVTRIHNDPDALTLFYAENKDEIWVGFNNRHYDQYILKAILCKLDVKWVSDAIIKWGWGPMDIDPVLVKIPMINYDVMQRNDGGLKSFEGMMGHNIHESSVDFDTPRPLTEEEIELTFEYCENDVQETMEVFYERKADFDAQLGLIGAFQMPLKMMSKTKTQLSAEILGAYKIFTEEEDDRRHWCTDEFDLWYPECARVEKYQEIIDWFFDRNNRAYKIGKHVNQQTVMMAGLEMKFGWGGVHGAKKHYHAKGYFVNMDVGSLYPSIMLNWPEKCFSRAVSDIGIDRFRQIYETRMALKKAGKKAEQAPYKIVLNSTYGAFKDKFNKMYDPRASNNVCLTGQVLVGIDLFERLEPYCEIIQVNTDGILVRMEHYEDFDKIDEIAHEWEVRTGLKLDFDDYGYGEIWQKDVNNYLIVDEWGEYKCKGKYIKKLSRIDYDCPILNEAMKEYMLHGVPVEQTVNQCNELIKFQQIKKISSKFTAIYQDCRKTKTDWILGHKLNEKCIRIFASNDWCDGTFVKTGIDNRLYKIDDTPDCAFCINGDVTGMSVPEKLDKNWYITKAKERLKGYGAMV